MPQIKAFDGLFDITIFQYLQKNRLKHFSTFFSFQFESKSKIWV